MKSTDDTHTAVRGIVKCDETLKRLIETNPNYSYTTSLKPLERDINAHKNTYGHALLICGSRGMTGAAVLAARGALRSGCGLVTVHLPESERFIVQTATPSAMVSFDGTERLSVLPDLSKYTAVGIGSGLGATDINNFERFLVSIRKAQIKLLIDADAIRLIGNHSELLNELPANCVFTPHQGELRCLVGEWGTYAEMLQKSSDFAQRTTSVVVVKGANTAICLPNGKTAFNTTGNAGMAKGGSGDVLTGLITGLMARGLQPADAAVRGVFVHGAAGDTAASVWGKESMCSNDIADYIKV